jgi:thiol-disulfide isomerase/thioredoxin
MARAAVLENIVGALKTKQDREDWIKQVADCYGTAAQNGDSAALAKLTEWTTKLVKQEPGSNIAGYLAYREMTADYARKLADVKAADMSKLQDEWKDRLAKFVQDFPNVEDAPDALMQLGMVNEFIGKETEAKNWYAELVKNFPKSQQMPKADGAIRRLTCEGKAFDLHSKVLGTGNAFNVSDLKGKTVLVYYWASWNTQCVADFAKIKQLMGVFGPKGVELVCVNLDSSPADAIKFLQTTPVVGTHLYEKGVPDGQDSPLAVNYGIMVLPHMFILDNQNIVVSRNAQVATLEEEFKKLFK